MDWLFDLRDTAGAHPFTTAMTVGAFLLAWLGGRHALTEGGLTARNAWPAAAAISILFGVYTFFVARGIGEASEAAFIVQGATLFGFFWAWPRKTSRSRRPRPLPVHPPGTGPAARAFQPRR